MDSPDLRWMRRALELARRGRFGASPNPMVGAVVLDARGEPAGEGWHARYGGPHAEVAALETAGPRARGGTLFVTLEPCAHHGKTPPCTTAILDAAIARVVVAMEDPNPVAGGGLHRLREAGVEVTVGVAGDEARRLNRRWLRLVRERRPWVTAKAAVSLDGRIATRTGESRWITGEAARRRGLELREEHDAILVGVGTVLADDPRLTRRLGLNPGGRWLRVVLDTALRTPLEARVVREDPGSTLLVHTTAAPRENRSRLEAAGVRLLEVPAGEGGRPEPAALLAALASEPVAALLVEGGGTVHGAFVDAGLVDELHLFVAPLLIGGAEAPTAVAGRGCAALADARTMVIETVHDHGPDLEICAVRREESHVHGSR